MIVYGRAVHGVTRRINCIEFPLSSLSLNITTSKVSIVDMSSRLERL